MIVSAKSDVENSFMKVMERCLLEFKKNLGGGIPFPE